MDRVLVIVNDIQKYQISPCSISGYQESLRGYYKHLQGFWICHIGMSILILMRSYLRISFETSFNRQLFRASQVSVSIL